MLLEQKRNTKPQTQTKTTKKKNQIIRNNKLTVVIEITARNDMDFQSV